MVHTREISILCIIYSPFVTHVPEIRVCTEMLSVFWYIHEVHMHDVKTARPVSYSLTAMKIVKIGR